MAMQSTSTEVDPRVMLHARVLYRDRNGEISDATHRKLFGLKDMADTGQRAVHIMDECMKRLELLSCAAESQSQVDSAIVRMVVQDVTRELESGSTVSSFVHLSQEMFEYSKALPPDARDNSGSLTLVKSAS